MGVWEGIDAISSYLSVRPPMPTTSGDASAAKAIIALPVGERRELLVLHDFRTGRLAPA